MNASELPTSANHDLGYLIRLVQLWQDAMSRWKRVELLNPIDFIGILRQFGFGCERRESSVRIVSGRSRLELEYFRTA